MSQRSLRFKCHAFILCMLLSQISLPAQSSCFIRSNDVFRLESQPKTSTTAVSKRYFDRIAWSNIGPTDLVDESCTLIALEPDHKSQALWINSFGFELPASAIITGIEVKMFGHAIGDGVVKDYRLYLTGSDGKSKGFNKANKALKGKPWNQEASIYDYWSYGSERDDWGHDWTADDINNDNFGVSIELQNRSNESIEAHLDQILITVFYEAALDFCDNDRYISIYADPEANVKEYVWDIPEELSYDSQDHMPFLLTLAAENSEYGVYEICLTKIYNDDTEEQCCKALEFRHCAPSSIGNYVWHDLNGNGLQDSQEPGIDNKRVYLYSESMEYLAETVTDEGNYLFDNLDPGRYFIKVAINDMEITQSHDSDDDNDSDFFEFLDEKMSRLIILEAGQNIENIDFGFAEKSSIEGLCWLDKNANGVFESDDEMLSEVNVELLDENDDVVKSTISGADGQYIIGNIDPGNYKLRFFRSEAYLPSDPGTENDIDADYLTESFDLVVNDRLMYDAAFYRTAALSGLAWLDTDYDNTLGNDDIMLEAVNVQLLDCQDNYITELETGTDGQFDFTGLKPGEYKLCAETRRQDIYIPKSIECTSCITIIENELNSNSEFIFNFDANDLEITIFEDRNNNGIIDGENPVENLLVTLYDCDDTVLATSSSDIDGLVMFDGLPDGSYYYTIDLATDLFVDSASDFESNNSIIQSPCIDLSDDEVSLVPLLSFGSIGDYVWHDKNRNGLLDNAEMGLESIDFQLVDEAGQIIAETSSDADGHYIFEGLHAGRYRIVVDNLETLFIPALNNDDDAEANSDFFILDDELTTDWIELSYFEDKEDIDLGLQSASSNSNSDISGYVFIDGDGNLEQVGEDGMAAITVSLYSCGGTLIDQQTTDQGGYYEFIDVPGGLYYITWTDMDGYTTLLGLDSDIDETEDELSTVCFGIEEDDIQVDMAFLPYSQLGDLVWLDENVDGQQDASEPGLAGIDIILLDEDDNVIGSTTTDLDGFYRFENLIPGTYRLELPSASESYTPTLQDMGDEEKDSELRLEQERYVSELITLVDGIVELDYDLGLNFHQSIVGGTVYVDENMDGTRSGVETGMADVRVELYNADDELLQETTTDADGIYRFYNLYTGLHYIKFELPDGYVFSPANMGQDELFDSDVEDAEGRTHNLDITGSKVIEGVNAGLFATSACISGYYWIDLDEDGLLDMDDTGSKPEQEEEQSMQLIEPRVANAAVSLFNADGAFVQSVFTDNNGQYVICDIPEGEYYINFELLPGYVFTEAYVGTDERLDSDVVNQEGDTDIFRVEKGGMYYGINSGIYIDNTSPVNDDSNKDQSITVDNLEQRNNSRSIVEELTGWSSVYPNPSYAGEIQMCIKSEGTGDALSYRIMDMQSKLIANQNLQSILTAGEHRFAIDTQMLETGAYILQILHEKKIENHRVVIFNP